MDLIEFTICIFSFGFLLGFAVGGFCKAILRTVKKWLNSRGDI